MTDFKDGLGRDIPADAFENEPGPPRPLPLSEADRKAFEEKWKKKTEG